MLVEFLQRITSPKVRSIIRPLHRVFFPNKIYGYWNITFRCTYHCSYCPFCSVFEYSKIYPKESEKTPEQWLKILEKLPPMSFLLIGGEPLLYQGLPEIINNLPKKHSIIGLISNASLPIELYKKLDKKICTSISFHREFAKEEEFIEKVLELNKFMWINSVNIVATPENIPFLETLHAKLSKTNITLRVEPLIKTDFSYTDEQYKQIQKYLKWDRNFERKQKLYEAPICKSCSSGKNYINIMPNGDVYSCVGGMEYINTPYRHAFIKDEKDLERYRLCNLEDENFSFNSEKRDCIYPCIYACDWDYADITTKK